jgi:CelD/BcsL family acetyltransferase involved in cellulose biosynthesis
MRASCRQAANRLQKAGRFRIEHFRLPQDVPRLIEEYLEVEERSWKARSGLLVSRSEVSMRRFGELLRVAAGQGWLNAGTLYFEDKPIAMAVNLDYKDATYCLFTNFDEAYGRLSPGLYVQSQMIRESFASGRKIYDWLGRNDAYKMKFARLARSNLGYYIFEKTWPGRLAAMSDRLACRWRDEPRDRRDMRSAV